MSDWVHPVITSIAVGAIASAWLLARRGRSLSIALTKLDKFASDADLAVTPDVELELVALFRKRSRRGGVVLSIASAVLAGLLVGMIEATNRAFADAGPTGTPADPALGHFAFFTALLLLIVGFSRSFVSPAVHWRTAGRPALAHARRTGLRDYVDPVMGLSALILLVSLSGLCVALLLWPGSPVGRSHPTAVLCFLALYTIENSVQLHRGVQRRSRASTVQQLAFNDALICEDVAGLLSGFGIVGFLSCQFLSQAGSTSFGVEETLDLIGIFYIAANLFLTVRTRPAARRFKARLYPETPRPGEHEVAASA